MVNIYLKKVKKTIFNTYTVGSERKTFVCRQIFTTPPPGPLPAPLDVILRTIQNGPATHPWELYYILFSIYFPVCKCLILYLKSCTNILINVRLLWICLCKGECDQWVQLFSWLLDLNRVFLTCSLRAQESLLRKYNLYRSYAKIDYLIQNSICLHLKTYFVS